MSRVAVVFCVHHKPWLMMSTLITAFAQDCRDVDLHFVYNVGAGGASRPTAPGQNRQLSPFDERVRGVCRVSHPNVFEVEYENDEALDSGAWYKFIRERRWERYDWVLFVGEGTLFARPGTLSGLLAFASSRSDVHVVASGHEKRRLPKSLVLDYRGRKDLAAETDLLHDRMMSDAFAVFCRDPEFQRLFDAWHSDFAVETQNHVPPAGPPSPALRRWRGAWTNGVGPRWPRARLLPWSIECAAARARVAAGFRAPAVQPSEIYVDGVLRPIADVADVTRIHDEGFHRVDGPEWFGCATNHLMSRTYLERFTARLDRFQMWDVLSLPFAGSALEVIWGFLPAWLGVDKWFTDGFHRVRKDFVTYEREDAPPQMATYINRYFAGRLAVGWRGDFLKLRGMHRDLAGLREQLPAVYF